MLTFMLVFATAAGLPDLPRQWAQFSRAGALNHITDTVDIATGNPDEPKVFRYTLRFTRQGLDGKARVRWADSATCPAILAVMADMPNIKMPSPAPYGLPGQPLTITVDGAHYALTAPSSDNMGRLSLSSNIGSPLAAWIDTAFEKLNPCWQTTAPR